MATIESLFVTQVYRAELAGAKAERLNGELEAACLSIARGRRGRPTMVREERLSGLHLLCFAQRPALAGAGLRRTRARQLDAPCGGIREGARIRSRPVKLTLDSLWINILPPGGMHTSHIHPHSVVSGTYYVTIPDGASAIKLEDPRLGFMMAAPPRKKRAGPENRQFAYIAPASRERCCSGKAGCATKCR